MESFAAVCQDIPLLFRIKLRTGLLYTDLLYTLLCGSRECSSVSTYRSGKCFEQQLQKNESRIIMAGITKLSGMNVTAAFWRHVCISEIFISKIRMCLQTSWEYYPKLTADSNEKIFSHKNVYVYM
jgi:hypothetical protein